MDQVAQQESPIPCHITTGRNVELNDKSSLLGSGLYGVGSDRGLVSVKEINRSARIVTRVSTTLLRLLGRACVAVGARST